MRTLFALEFAFGLFVIAFIVWQVAIPLLMGRRPFNVFHSSPEVRFRKMKPSDPKLSVVDKKSPTSKLTDTDKETK